MAESAAGADTTPAADPAPTTPATPAAPAATVPADKTPPGDLPQTHEQLNALMKKHKTTLQTELADKTEKANAYEELRHRVEKFTEGQDVDEFMGGVQQTLAKLDTEAERSAKDAKKAQKALDESTKRAELFQGKYQSTLINNAVDAEAAAKVVSPADLKYIRYVLSEHAKPNLETGEVVFSMSVTDEDGDTEVKDLTAKEAVALLEDDVQNYGGHFKVHVNSGAGLDPDGNKRVSGKDPDVMNMDYADYHKLKKENPELYKRLLAEQTQRK